MSSSIYIDNKNKYILLLGEDPTPGLDILLTLAMFIYLLIQQKCINLNKKRFKNKIISIVFR